MFEVPSIMNMITVIWGISFEFKDIISQSPIEFNASIYNSIRNITSTVTFPIGAAFFSMFMLMDVVNVWQRSGMDGMANSDMIIKTLIKVSLFAYLFSHVFTLLDGLVGVSIEIMNGIDTSGQVELLPPDLSNLEELLNTLSNGEKMGLWLTLFILQFVLRVVYACSGMIIAARMIELFIMMAFAPIPLSTLPHPEMRSVGINYIKSFLSVCIQGSVMVFVIYMFAIIVGASNAGNPILGATKDAVTDLKLLYKNLINVGVYSIFLLMSLMSSGRIAKSICNAM